MRASLISSILKLMVSERVPSPELETETMTLLATRELFITIHSSTAKLGTIYFVYAIPALSLLYILSKYIRTQENLYAIMFYMAVTGGEKLTRTSNFHNQN